MLKNHQFLVACSLLLLATGCGGKEKTYGQVGGRVVSAGKPVVEAVVLFEDPTQHLFIQATTDKDGYYQFDKLPGGGLPVGSYRIAVQPPVEEIKTGEPIPPPKPFPKIDPSLLEPAKSGLTLEVKIGKNPFDIDLIPKK